jgi:hypothetical protein
MNVKMRLLERVNKWDVPIIYGFLFFVNNETFNF